MASRRIHLALILGGLAIPGLSACLFAAALLVQRPLLAPLRTPFPKAALLTTRTRFDWPGRLSVTRQYLTSAPRREVIEWYWGKDSLMPLPAILPTACSQYYYDRPHPRLPYVRGGFTEEEVTICASSGRVIITSATTFNYPAIAP